MRLLPLFRNCIIGMSLLVALWYVFFVVEFSDPNGHDWGWSPTVQCHAIALAMNAYANDHHVYPAGRSSTEIFQKLIDGGYVKEPGLFYIPLAGKCEPTLGQKLKPENVSFDVTDGVTPESSDSLPIVYSTGYKVDYTPRGVATPLVKPFPTYGYEDYNHTWFDRWMGRPTIHFSGNGRFAVGYKTGGATLIGINSSEKFIGSIPNFISPDFKLDGKTYRQLTPDGPLP